MSHYISTWKQKCVYLFNDCGSFKSGNSDIDISSCGNIKEAESVVTADLPCTCLKVWASERWLVGRCEIRVVECVPVLIWLIHKQTLPGTVHNPCND